MAFGFTHYITEPCHSYLVLVGAVYFPAVIIQGIYPKAKILSFVYVISIQVNLEKYKPYCFLMTEAAIGKL